MEFALQLVPVGQPGQRIVTGAVLDLAFGPAQFGDLMGYPDPHTMFGQPARRPLDVHTMTVLVDVAVAKVKLQRAASYLFRLLHGARAVVRMDQLEDGAPQHFRWRITEDALETGVDKKQTTIRIDDANRIGYQIKQFGGKRQSGDHDMAESIAADLGAVTMEYTDGEGSGMSPCSRTLSANIAAS